MTFANNTTPKFRQEQLVVQEFPDEVLIYDLETNRAFCLNQTAAFIWRNCDGHNTVNQITYLLSKKLKTPVEETVVWFALQELQEKNLISAGVVPPANLKGLNRRQLLRTLGKATAVAVPMIFAITAPTAASAQSACLRSGEVCTSNAQCCSNLCEDIGNGTSACSGGGCVLYDTPIITADGQTVKAIDVFIGQELLGINCINGEKVAGKVKKIMKFSAKGFYSITAESGDSVQCSPTHPLINGFGDKWGKPVEQFRAGDSLLVYDQRQQRIVEAKTVGVEYIKVSQPVIIFEMDSREHTFISSGIISHNKIDIE